MEKFHSSRSWRRNAIGSAVMARSDYGEVFGGPPRHTAPFSLQLEDYFEIFGSAASAASIPLLDLPPADDFETVGAGAGEHRDGLDYSDVFGVFGSGGFAASYEELFREPKRSGPASSPGRTQCDELSPHQEKKVVEQSVNGNSDDVGLKQFIPHHLLSQEPQYGVTSENIQKAKPGAVSGYSVDFDTIDSVYEMKGKLKNEAAPNFTSCANSSTVNPNSDMTQPKSTCAFLLNINSDEKLHSQSSSYHSTSSGDMPLDDVMYLQVSEISLKTKPLQGPPPSRSPPELSKKAEHPKVTLTDSRPFVQEECFLQPSIHKSNESTKDISFLKDELDPNSAAARSIALVKEAMEQAHARIKSAKELRDRRRDKWHTKLVPPEALNVKEDVAAYEVEPQNCSSIVADNLFRKSNMVSEHTFVEGEKIMIEGKTALSNEDIKVRLSPCGMDQQLSKGNACKQPEFSSEIGDIPGEWMRDKEHYEITSNDEFFDTGTYIYIQEDEKKEKAAVHEAIIFEENQKSTEVSFCTEKLKKDTLKVADIAWTEVKENFLDASVDSFLLIDSASELEEAHGSHQSDENQNFDAQKDNTNVNMIIKPNTAVNSCLHKESEKNSRNPNCVFNIGVANEDCEEKLLEVAEGISSYVECGNNLNVSDLKSEINDSYKEVKVPSEFLLQDMFEKEIRVPEELFTYNTNDEKEVAEGLEPYSNYEVETKMKPQYSYDEFRCNVEKSNSATEKDEDDGVQTDQDTHILGGNELDQKLIYDENGLENFKMQGKIKNAELEPILNSRHATYYTDCNIKRSIDGETTVQEDEPVEALVDQEVQSSDILETPECTCSKKLSENITEVSVPYKFVKNQSSLNSTDEIFRLAEIEESNTQVFFLRKEDNLLAATQDSKGVAHSEMAENRKHSSREEVNKRKMNRVGERDEEQEISIEEKELNRAIEKNKIIVEQINYEACQQALEQEMRIDEKVFDGEREKKKIVEQINYEVHQQLLTQKLRTERKESDREREKNKITVEEINYEAHQQVLEHEVRIREKELGREREINNTIEQINYEARQQALAEAQKRAERIAVERATSEARQRALADARERAEKAAEAEKASREARLRSERAAVERATEEARRRAIEKAIAMKVAAGTREHTTQVNSSNKDRMRKDNGTSHFKATHHIKEDYESTHKSTSTQIPRKSQSQNAPRSANGHRDSDYSNHGGIESNMRYKAGQERQQPKAEHAANALCERNMRDIHAQREQAERDRLAESLDVMVKRWSTGKDGNLRLLLSTLQYILAPESGWQTIPLTDLANVPAVKKAYRKATLCVHPDKLQQRGATIQQKYICEKVFDLLQEAWDKFNSAER